MAVSEEDGSGHTLETIRVEYEWKPPLCIDCHVFGQSQEQCPKRVKEQVSEAKSVDNDGFTKVTKKKKKTKQPSSSKQPKTTHVNTKNQFDTLEDQIEDMDGFEGISADVNTNYNNYNI
ncbi:hypothetical protein Tco_1272095 [Tanacetum coccineum]